MLTRHRQSRITVSFGSRRYYYEQIRLEYEATTDARLFSTLPERAQHRHRRPQLTLRILDMASQREQELPGLRTYKGDTDVNIEIL